MHHKFSTLNLRYVTSNGSFLPKYLPVATPPHARTHTHKFKSPSTPLCEPQILNNNYYFIHTYWMVC